MDGQDLKGLRIGMLTSSASRLGAGVAEAVIAQVEMIRAVGGEAVVFALEDRHSEDDRHRYGASEVVFNRVVGPAQVGYAPDLLPRMLAADLDVVHQQGIWMYPSRAGALWTRRTGRPYIVTPQGMLDPWITARGRWKKALARRGYERDAWARAAFLHGLSAKEAADIARESGRTDTVVLPNVGPAALPPPTEPRGREIFFISRIHPKKNVLALVEAWKLLGARAGDWRLILAGWGAEEDVADLRAAIADAPPSLEFIGPTFGEDKQRRLESARFTILPSHSEGLPLAILESWAAGTPSIMTHECNLPEGFAANAALECGFDPPAIAQTIAQAIALDDGQWLDMARNAHALAAGPFSVGTVAQSWAQHYRRAIAEAQARRAR